MTRIAAAALLAIPLLSGNVSTTTANDGPCTFGLGCGGYCLRLFPRIHQHGPLFNYGPYYGYPPFEPYGYWNSYLQYTGPIPDPVYGYGQPPNYYGWKHGGAGIPHPFQNGGGVLHHGGGIIHGHKHGECSTCGQVAATYLNSGNALDRYTGRGDPVASSAYYADSPTTVITAGFTGR